MLNELAEIRAAIGAIAQPTVPAGRLLRKAWSQRLRHLDGEEMLSFALRVQQGRSNFYRFIAQELVHHHRPAMDSLQATWLRQFGEGMSSWDAVDVFACYLAGPTWREGQVSDAEIKRWARSKDVWWRRAAVVCTVALNNQARGGKGDAVRSLLICEMLLDDHEDMVVKAMSWALRELDKREPSVVQDFLKHHREELAARVLREVGNKLRTGKKNPR